MRTININLQNGTYPMNRFFDHCVGSGRAGEMLRAETIRQLEMLQDACHFRYLRFHGLLSDDMAVCSLDEHGQCSYNWQYIDLVFDAMLRCGIRPLVELGFMPDCLKSGAQTIFWWKGNVTPPASMNHWCDLVRALVLHITARYGAQEISQWYFEVWNEPNLPAFFTGTQQEYFALYDATAKTIKEVNAQYRVGGPATAGLDEGAWIAEMIEHCAQHHVPIDFISTHSYGVDGAVDEFGLDTHRLKATKDPVVADVRNVRSLVKASAMPELPVFFTEWSTSYTPRDNVHDSYISAPYILHTLKHCEGYAESMSYWTFTDIFEEAGPGPSPFHGGFGLINIQGLKKPAFHAYHWLCAMPGEALDTQDDDSYAAKDETSLQVLLWDYSQPKQDDVNERYFIRDLPSAALPDATVVISGLDIGDYTMETYRVGYMHNDVYTQYLRAGLRELHGRETPTPGQIEALKRLTDGKAETFKRIQVTADGRVCLSIPLRENEVVRLVVRRNPS